MRVLVVDDDLSVCMLLSEILATAGYQVDTAGDGQEGLDRLGQEAYDLLITDLNMPEMDGHELIAAAAERFESLPVLAMTAEATVDNIAATFDGGVKGFLVKPFHSLDKVLEKVQRTLASAGVTR